MEMKPIQNNGNNDEMSMQYTQKYSYLMLQFQNSDGSSSSSWLTMSAVCAAHPQI